MICQGGYKNLRIIVWMKVFQLKGSHPGVLLVNQHQSREEKWYRASTVFVLTCKKCEICMRTKITRVLGSSLVDKWCGVGVDGDLLAAHEVEAGQVPAGLA